MATLKLIIMGMGGVGKSAITHRFVDNKFVARYDPTIEDSYTKTVTVEGKAYELEILDTAGQEQYSALRENFMHTGNGFILVYSIVDDATFEGLRDIRNEILRVHPNPKVPMLLVGNKCDLASERAVSEDEARAMASSFDECPAIEVSAKTNTNVAEMFTTLVRNVLAADPSAGSGGGGAVLGAGTTAKAAAASDGKRTKKRSICTLL